MSSKAGTLWSAQQTGTQALQNAQNFDAQQQQTLGNQASGASSNVNALNPQVQAGIAAQSNVPNSTFDPNQVNNTLTQFGGATNTANNASAIGNNLSNTAALTPSINPTVNAGYGNFASTGGISPTQAQQFLQNSTRAAASNYNAQSDTLNRRLALQGGYMPGFTSSQAALTRGNAQSQAVAATGADTTLTEQENANKLAGLSGLQGMTAQEQAALQAAQQTAIGAQTAGGNITNTAASNLNAGAIGQGNFATAQASNQVQQEQVQQQALNTLMSYYQSNVNQMTTAEQQQLANQMMLLGASAQQINTLLGKAGQTTSTAQNITTGINDAATLGGAAASGANTYNSVQGPPQSNIASGISP